MPPGRQTVAPLITLSFPLEQFKVRLDWQLSFSDFLFELPVRSLFSFSALLPYPQSSTSSHDFLPQSYLLPQPQTSTSASIHLPFVPDTSPL